MPATKALGIRRRCLSCATAFYDLGRTPILCPKCGAEFTVVELPRRPEPFRKYGAPFVSPVKEAPEEPLPAEEESDELLARDDDDADDEPAADEDAEPEGL
jgi:hypothetical protein